MILHKFSKKNGRKKTMHQNPREVRQKEGEQKIYEEIERVHVILLFHTYEL